MSNDRYEIIDKFIRLHKFRIKNNNYQDLYRVAAQQFIDSEDGEQIGILTERLMMAGINPLEYMTHIPSLYMNSFEGETVDIPDCITAIHTSAFEDSFIDSVVIPDSVTNIGQSAFEFCTMLTKVSLSRNLSRIPRKCFYYCDNLESIKIPAGVTHIENSAFEESGIKYIELPSTLQYLAQYSLLSQPRDIEIKYYGTSEDFRNIKKQFNWCDIDSSNIMVHCDDGSFEAYAIER